MTKQMPNASRRKHNGNRLLGQTCHAQRKAGITDGSSKQGVAFCTSSCPYPNECKLAINQDHEANNTEALKEWRKKRNNGNRQTTLA